MNKLHIILALDNQRLGQEYNQFWPSYQPEHIMREDVNHKLGLLAQIVTFGWLDNVVQQEEKYTWAYTNCNKSLSVRLEMGALGSGEKGFGSKISIGMLQTREMRAVRRRSPRNFKNLGRILRYQLVITIIVCHETVHALGHAM